MLISLSSWFEIWIKHYESPATPDESIVRPPGCRFNVTLCNFPCRHGGLVATGFARGRNVISARPFKYVLRPLRFFGTVGVNGEQDPAIFHPAFVALGLVLRYAHTDQGTCKPPYGASTPGSSQRRHNRTSSNKRSEA